MKNTRVKLLLITGCASAGIAALFLLPEVSGFDASLITEQLKLRIWRPIKGLFLFRTQYKGFDEYPATGIADENFPHEVSVNLKSLLMTPLKQMAHPFLKRPAWPRRQGRVHND